VVAYCGNGRQRGCRPALCWLWWAVLLRHCRLRWPCLCTINVWALFTAATAAAAAAAAARWGWGRRWRGRERRTSYVQQLWSDLWLLRRCRRSRLLRASTVCCLFAAEMLSVLQAPIAGRRFRRRATSDLSGELAFWCHRPRAYYYYYYYYYLVVKQMVSCRRAWIGGLRRVAIAVAKRWTAILSRSTWTFREARIRSISYCDISSLTSLTYCIVIWLPRSTGAWWLIVGSYVFCLFTLVRTHAAACVWWRRFRGRALIVCHVVCHVV